MVSVEKATIADFDKICELLKDHSVSNKENRSLLKAIYQGRFDCGEGYYGYVLKEGQDTVGTIGLIFSRRRINGRVEKFCNLTSWIVRPEHRAKALALLQPILELRDYTVTALSATKQAYEIYKKLGFQELENTQVVIFPLMNMRNVIFKKAELIRDAEKIEGELHDTQLKQIMKDHTDFRCRHLLIKAGDRVCYVIYNISRKKRIPVAVINFISDPALFAECLDMVRMHMLFKERVLLILVEQRLLKGCAVRFSTRRRLPVPPLFRSESLTAEDIDNLYSEKILLNIN